MYCKNEEIVKKSSYQKNESFIKEGHELHEIRNTLHVLSVEAVGVREWNKFTHNCPIKMLPEKLEALINNAVDLSNWAVIENHDPIDNFEPWY